MLEHSVALKFEALDQTEALLDAKQPFVHNRTLLQPVKKYHLETVMTITYKPTYPNSFYQNLIMNKNGQC